MTLLPILSIFKQTKLLATPLQYLITKSGYAAPGIINNQQLKLLIIDEFENVKSLLVMLKFITSII